MAPIFNNAAKLQDYLLTAAGPQTLIIVPHRRLAQQVWHRQRLANLAAHRTAWEPLRLLTLQAWWLELFRQLWPPLALAGQLTRLALWRRAMAAAPPLAGAANNLSYTQALDEAHQVLARHGLSTTLGAADDPPLMVWRRQVSAIYEQLLAEGGWLTPAQLPTYLQRLLETAKIRWPKEIVVVSLTSPAPAEYSWLEAVSRQAPLRHLHLAGDPLVIRQAVLLPDPQQEMEWVAARLLESAARQGVPLHRLAVTSPVMTDYAPKFRRVLRELLGPARQGDGWAYNFSQGEDLAATCLFQAALLPLKFCALGERREDLAALLWSPYYEAGRQYGALAGAWDWRFRDQRLEQGWQRLRRAMSESGAEIPGHSYLLERLGQVFGTPAPLGTGTAVNGSGQELGEPGALSPYTREERGGEGKPPLLRDGLDWLQRTWQALGFPGPLQDSENLAWPRLLQLLRQAAAFWGEEPLTGPEVLDLLSHGARQELLPGPGVQEAGLQVLGWLEMRGLSFDQVFCLGMNAGSCPPPPRPLPLLNAAERRKILGGTYESQEDFAREAYKHLLAAAPHLVLSRPALKDEEPQSPTPLYLGSWQETEISVLGQPDPAWLRAPAVLAALSSPSGTGVPLLLAEVPPLPLPAELQVTQVQTALNCPCRFLLEILLQVQELPEIQTGLPPQERGRQLHRVLARFVQACRQKGGEQPQEPEAWLLARLEEAARREVGPLLADPHWQAEWERWFAQDDSTPGLLPAWLHNELERLSQGWGWQGVELPFQGVTAPQWPFTLKGRIDRLDYRPATYEHLIWDYKSGEIPKAARVFQDKTDFQLAGYLLAARQGKLPEIDPDAHCQAGYIGLKSTRNNHLKHQDFQKQADDWPEVLEFWESHLRALGKRLSQGDFRPDPHPPPLKSNLRACEYCPYPLICGWRHRPSQDLEDDA